MSSTASTRRAQSRPQSQGSGLGLSIALENAHIHGGEITADNHPEGGAVFTLRLPMDASRLADAHEDENDTGGRRDGGGVTQGRGRPPRGR